MLSKIICHDIRCGVTANGWRYVLVAFFFSVMSGSFFVSVRNAPPQLLYPQASTMDGWIQHMAGIGIYLPDTGAPFPIPISWLIFQALMALLISSYPTRDLYGYGTQILLRTKRYSLWWFSKCLWSILTVILFYAVGILVTCFFSAALGQLSYLPNTAINQGFTGVALSESASGEILLITVALPVLTSIALSLMQMALSFILSPIYGYFAVMCYALASAYYCSPFLSANAMMVLRHASVLPGGISTASALCVNTGIIVASVTAGLLYLKSCDLIKSGRKE